LTDREKVLKAIQIRHFQPISSQKAVSGLNPRKSLFFRFFLPVSA